AARHSAHVEAISHLTQALALLQTLPATPERSQHELTLHIALGASLIATKGHAAPEVEQTYAHARQLCQHLDDPHQLFPVLHGLRNYYNARRVSDGPRPGRAAPDSGAAGPGPCSAPGGAPCPGVDVVPPRSGSRCAYALCTGDGALRPPAAPRFCVPLWGGRERDLSQLCC